MKDTETSRSRKKRFKERRRKTKLLNYGIIFLVLLFLLFSVFLVININAFMLGSANLARENEAILTKDAKSHSKPHLSLNTDHNVLKKTKEIEYIASDDPNIIEAYKMDWDPIPTEQSEPHKVVFEKDSLDWQEMEEAIKMATQLEDMTVHWIGNGGEQKVIGTVSSPNGQEIFKVYLSWITEKGWLPTKVERLKEIDH